MAKPQVVCAPAGEDDLLRLGEIFHHALSPSVPALFPDGQPSNWDVVYPWRASVLRLYYLGMTDPKQKELRGPYRSFLWKATATAATSTASGDADASRRTVGAIAFTITPSPEDTAAVAKIQEADALLPPVLPPPDGFNLGAFKDMIGACKAWNKAHIPSHSVLSVNIFVVDPDAQGLGVGAKLFAEAKAEALRTRPQPGDKAAGIVLPGKNGVPLVLNAVPSAVGFYKKQGLRDEGAISLGLAKETFYGMIYQED